LSPLHAEMREHWYSIWVVNAGQVVLDGSGGVDHLPIHGSVGNDVFHPKAHIFGGGGRRILLLVLALPVIARRGPGPWVPGFRWKPSVHWLCKAQ